MASKLALLLAIPCTLFALESSLAQNRVWQPSSGHTQVPIWPGEAPDSQATKNAEIFVPVNDPKEFVAGRTWLSVEHVSQPTMTVYRPNGINTGVGVVVLPGGGYSVLAIDLEGTEVCEWLSAHGVTCVLLKYRVPDSGPAYHEDCRCNIRPKAPTALEDAQRTVGLVRFHAAELNINPRKIGVLGFSAGGHLAANISAHFAERLYPLVDAADRVSCRPDFAVLIYPGHMLENASTEFGLNPEIPVTSNTPPTFLVQAEDDSVDGVKQSLVYYIALEKAGVPVEMHLYAQGGHAFGLRRTGLPITIWPRLVATWLETIGMISQ